MVCAGRCCEVTEGSPAIVPDGRIKNPACAALGMKHGWATCSLCHLNDDWRMTCKDHVPGIEGDQHLKSAKPAPGVLDRITYKALADNI